MNPALALTPRGEFGALVLSLSVIGPVILLTFVGLDLASQEWNVSSLAIVAACVVGYGVYLGWGWSSLMRWSGTVRPASDRLRGIASRVAEQIDIRPRAIEQVALPMANAFAFFSTNSIGVTDAALAVLSDNELDTICLHELAHLAESRWVRAARLSYGFVLALGIAVCGLTPGVLNSLGSVPFALLYLANIVVLITAIIWYRRLVLRMEIRADALVRRFEVTPGVYAGALEKLYATNMVPVVLGSRRKTHPELFDRMITAGVSPDYARPEPPPRRPLYIGLVVMLIGATLGILGLGRIAHDVPRAVLDTESAALWTIGMDGGSLTELVALWNIQYDRGTLSKTPDEIDSITAGPNRSNAAGRPSPVGELGAEAE
jgi:Zn-dependent protease with chaperone function